MDSGIRKLRMFAGVLMLLAIALVALASTAGSSPQACTSCHGVAADGLAETAHADVACYQCHAPSVTTKVSFKANEIFDMYPSQLLGGSPGDQPGVRSGASGCRSCHEDVLTAEEPITARGLRIRHDTCVPSSASCDTCHSTAAHGTAVRVAQGPSMGECVECHTDKGTTVECSSCHVEGYERNDLLAGPFSVTHGANWKQTHGLGDLRQCVLCHQQTDCGSCHGTAVPHPSDFGTTHGEASAQPTAKCQSCHRETFCSDCHGIEMPHPTGFLPQHSSLVDSVEEPDCMRCHTKEDCQRCHAQHVHPGGPIDRPSLDAGVAR